MDKFIKTCMVIAFLIISLEFVLPVNAQEIILLENDKGVQKSSFIRGEGLFITITVPYDAMVEIWLHNPYGAPGPSPVLFIPRTPVLANIQTKLGPRWMDEKAPCGKYQFEIRIFDSVGRLIKTEYRYFDYAMNEPPCAPTAMPPPSSPPVDITLMMVLIAGAVIAVIAVVAVIIFILRPRVQPPKERAPITPPVSPPTPPPTAPPKAPYKRRPIVKSEEEEA